MEGSGLTDHRIHYLSETLGLRAITLVTTNAVAKAQTLHRTRPTATAALGRCLSGAALLGASLKHNHSVTLRINGGGPAGTLLATCDAQGNVRAYIDHPEADAPPKGQGKLNVPAIVGRQGLLTVSYDLGLKSPYTGSAQLLNGEIAADLAYYLTTSEQIPSSVGLGVLVGQDGRVQASGGFLIQALPLGDSISKDQKQEQNQALTKIIERSETLTSISHMIEAGATPKDLLAEVMGAIKMREISQDPIVFSCKCNRNRALETLKTMDRDDIQGLINQNGNLEVTCEFCRETFYFDEDEIEAFLNPPDLAN